MNRCKETNGLELLITLIGVAMMGLTFLPDLVYMIIVFVGFFGLGLGMYATHRPIQLSLDLLTIKSEKLQGFIKWRVLQEMHLVLRFSAIVYSTVAGASSVHVYATVGIITNVIFAAVSLISIPILVPSAIDKK